MDPLTIGLAVDAIQRKGDSMTDKETTFFITREHGTEFEVAQGKDEVESLLDKTRPGQYVIYEVVKAYTVKTEISLVEVD